MIFAFSSVFILLLYVVWCILCTWSRGWWWVGVQGLYEQDDVLHGVQQEEDESPAQHSHQQDNDDVPEHLKHCPLVNKSGKLEWLVKYFFDPK